MSLKQESQLDFKFDIKSSFWGLKKTWKWSSQFEFREKNCFLKLVKHDEYGYFKQCMFNNGYIMALSITCLFQCEVFNQTVKLALSCYSLFGFSGVMDFSLLLIWCCSACPDVIFLTALDVLLLQQRSRDRSDIYPPPEYSPECQRRCSSSGCRCIGEKGSRVSPSQTTPSATTILYAPLTITFMFSSKTYVIVMWGKQNYFSIMCFFSYSYFGFQS